MSLALRGLKFGVVASAAFFAVFAADAATLDDFKTACTASGQASAANCACQADLAKDLTPPELATVIAGLSGNRADYITALNKLNADEAKVFYDKMDVLSTKAQSTCNAVK